jgi:hypothetical protein
MNGSRDTIVCAIPSLNIGINQSSMLYVNGVKTMYGLGGMKRDTAGESLGTFIRGTCYLIQS